MAIIADVMPLISMNRILVKKSLKVFNNSSRACILALKEVLKKQEFTSEDIAFLVAPKINVAGRIDNASLAIDFLSENDLDKAIEKFNILNDLIQQRRDLEENILTTSKINEKDNVLLVYDESFHQGVIGIVASKIAEKYKKISFVGNLNPKTKIIKMSARSYGEANLYNLLINSSKNLISYGGHRQAGGLSLYQKDFNNFKILINDNFKKQNIIYKEDSSIMGILPIDEVDYELLYLLDSYEPYGHHNEKPKFLIKNITFEEIKRVGAKKNCLKLSAKNKYGFLNMIMFNIEDNFNENFTKADIICNISKNVYKGNEYINIHIKEIIPALTSH
jgi:single-stranded-DNA-specific exonuclease